MEAAEPSYKIPKQLADMPYSSKLVIIKFEGPILEEWKEAVEELGVELADYLPDFSFIAKLPDKKAKDKLKELPFVEKILPFHPSYKLSPELAEAMHSKKNLDIAVIGFVGKDIRRAIQKTSVKTLNMKRTPFRHLAQINTKGTEIEELILSDDVLSVVPVEDKVLFNDVASTIIHSDTLASTGYTGKNQLVGVSDTGLDTGDVNDIHPDFAGRIKKLIPVGRPDDSSDRNGHGTHVAGSIVGTGAASNGEIKGMAPDAKIIFHSMDDEKGRLTGDLYEMWKESYDYGARIQSSSWGSTGEGVYGFDSYLADLFLWERKDMSSLVAAGNEGTPGELTDDGYYTVGSPATAKNVITVGASENLRNGSDLADDINDIATFSSKGPTSDGRIKPDIVAPGTHILSTRAIHAPDKNFWGNYNEYYAYMGGTSMATPILAGGAAQVREYLAKKGHTNPSGALMKSILITGADDLGLNLVEQGFGRANLVSSIAADFIDETNGLKTGESKTYQVNVTDTTKPFVFTLNWTDYPGSTTALAEYQELVNDLNLEVKSPSGKIFNGNDFKAPNNDVTDNVNNVEQIFYKKPEKGTYTITVRAYNIPQGPQPYAIATNGKFTAEGNDSGHFIDKKALTTTVKMIKDKYSLSIKGKVSSSVTKITVKFNGTTFTTTPKKGAFALTKTVSMKGNYVEELTVTAQDKKGKKEEVTVPTEIDLLHNDSITVDEWVEGDEHFFEFSGELTSNKVKSVFAVMDGEVYNLEIDEDVFSGEVVLDKEITEMKIVAVGITSQFEIVTFVKIKSGRGYTFVKTNS